MTEPILGEIGDVVDILYSLGEHIVLSRKPRTREDSSDLLQSLLHSIPLVLVRKMHKKGDRRS